MMIRLTASPWLSRIGCRVSKSEDALRERDTGLVRTLSYGRCLCFRYRGYEGSQSKHLARWRLVSARISLTNSYSG